MQSGIEIDFGSARERINRDEYERLLGAHAIHLDERGRRPLYFDGKFLAARDLVLDQGYELVRQAELGRAIGAGVVEGLEVSRGTGTSRLVIQPGHGITGAGESVVLDRPGGLEVDVADLVEIQDLNLRYRLSVLPKEPARTQTGVFVLALRAVEFTANPVASYPTSVDGERSIEDGEIVEATAVTLIPFPDRASPRELEQRRAHLARRIFHEGVERGLPAEVLPLAIVALLQTRVLWIDAHLARRSAGRPSTDLLGLGTGERELREAWLRQHAAHLDELFGSGPPGGRSIASDHFEVLPPAGPLPATGLDRRALTQTWFPAELDVELSLVPDDEVPALVEEALVLPGLDLEVAPEELATRAVLVLVPVPRAEYPGLQAALAAARARAAAAEPVNGGMPALAPGHRMAVSRVLGGLALRRPIDRVTALRARPGLSLLGAIGRVPIHLPEEDPADRLWRGAIDKAPSLWYVIRRRIERKLELFGRRLELVGHEEERSDALIESLEPFELDDELSAIRGKATPTAVVELEGFLDSNRSVLEHELLARNFLALVDAGAPPSIGVERVRMANGAFSYADQGGGIDRLSKLAPELASPEFVRSDYEPEDAARLDKLAAKANEALLAELATILVSGVLAADAGDRDARLHEVIEKFERSDTLIGRLRDRDSIVPGDTLEPEADGSVTREHVLEVLGAAEARESRILERLTIERARPIGAAELPLLPAADTREARIRALREKLEADPELGSGLKMLEESDRFFTTPKAAAELVATGLALEVDAAMRKATTAEARKALAKDLSGALSARSGDRRAGVERALETARAAGGGTP